MGSSSSEFFSVRSHLRNGVARILVQGELDLGAVPTLDEHLRLLEQDGVKAIILDLRDLSFLDSTGLTALLAASSRAAKDGHRRAIVGAPDPVRRLFEITGTERILNEPEGLRLLDRFTRDSPRRSRGSPERDGSDHG
jgi:anti-sigma B factor antagonist